MHLIEMRGRLLRPLPAREEDNAQVIFETLNDRGTPLLKADLIKNWVFQVGDKVHADVEKWYVRDGE